MKKLFLDHSGLVQRSGTDFIEPVAGPIESLKRSLSESVLGPVESVLKVQTADPFEVCSGLVWTQAGP